MAISEFKDTTATRKIFALKKRIRAVAGGTSASKTISILVWLIDYAQTMHNELISVVSESFPHLEMGAMQDFQDIMKAHGYWNDNRWHGTKHTYTFETGSRIQFFSVDTYGKAHGPRRDVLFVNECNNLEYKIVDQLITRTRKIVWFDWNPSVEFWFYTEMQPHRDDIDFITLTYKDNEALLMSQDKSRLKKSNRTSTTRCGGRCTGSANSATSKERFIPDGESCRRYRRARSCCAIGLTLDTRTTLPQSALCSHGTPRLFSMSLRISAA
jgi:hypothetical protein